MRSEDLAFLEAIAAAPADDTCRLAYADWLDERADPRGPFLRAQVELARLPPDHPGRQRLAARQEELFPRAREAYRRATPTEIAPYIESSWVGDYRRGCLSAIRLHADRVDAFVGHAAALFRYAPIDVLSFEPHGLLSSGGDTMFLATPTGSVQDLLRVPELARLGALVLNGPFADVDAVAQLVSACATLAGLRRLEFGERYGELERDLRLGMNPSSRRVLSGRFGGRVCWREGEYGEPGAAPDRSGG
jgi:uncharacterized protein (TIGR02996 family)